MSNSVQERLFTAHCLIKLEVKFSLLKINLVSSWGNFCKKGKSWTLKTYYFYSAVLAIVLAFLLTMSVR